MLQSTEEIELDIDQLPPAVLLKLYNTVMRPIKAKSSGRPSAGPARHSSHGGTGGLKRKSMDEEAEDEERHASDTENVGTSKFRTVKFATRLKRWVCGAAVCESSSF